MGQQSQLLHRRYEAGLSRFACHSERSAAESKDLASARDKFTLSAAEGLHEIRDTIFEIRNTIYDIRNTRI